jgi:CHAD domain-containing protein
MHAFLEAEMNEKPALQPSAAIGPTLRAIAALTIAKARGAITNPELSGADAVHEFRRTMKRWRALMRPLEPFVPDALLMRQQARDHARSLTKARDGQSALNAFEDLAKSGNLLLSEAPSTRSATASN